MKCDLLNGETYRHRHLVEYVAASTVSHCFDGWSFLARAFEAEMSGDPESARHLGYYAELRAAMSLLASEGIGIFNRHHVVISNSGKCLSYARNKNTHVLTWDALEDWATQPRSRDLLLQAVRPHGIPLAEWLSFFGGGTDFIAEEWLTQWGLDLSIFRKDHDSRNVASYRPSAFTSPGPGNIRNTVCSVMELWNMCGPGLYGGFSLMDRHLLRLVLGVLFKNRSGRSPKQSKYRYNMQVSSMLEDVPLTDSVRVELQKFLCFEIESQVPTLIIDAGKKNKPNHPNHSRQVLARATLLLRVATGSVSMLLDDSNAEFYFDLDFWWTSASVRRRLWNAVNPPTSFEDLWADVSDALDATKAWMDSSENAECHYSFWNSDLRSANVLTTPERIFLWGVSR